MWVPVLLEGLRYMDIQVDATTSGLKGALGYSA